MKYKDETKLEKIYAAVISLAGEYGLSGIRMSAVARKAGIAAGTLYIYFKSKEDLLNSLYVESMNMGTLALFNQLKEMPLEAQAEGAIRSSLRFRLAHPNRTIFVQEFQNSTMLNEEGKAIWDAYRKGIFQIIEKGQKEEKIKKAPIILLFHTIDGALTYAALANARGEVAVSEPEIDLLTACIWDMIKTH